MRAQPFDEDFSIYSNAVRCACTGGLGIRIVDAVINVDVAKDTEVHINRIGRTGRGDTVGLALFLCAPSERKWVKLIEAWQRGPLR